jgi:tRNA dimethylallyltransferase
VSRSSGTTPASVPRTSLGAPHPVPPLAAILLGPTASGKTALAVALASRLPVEVISADSRQVYRGLDIGTAKPTPEERRAVRHHLVDVLDLHETYNAARFAAEALACAADIRARGRIPLVVGGAGFYLKVLEEGLFEPPYGAAAQAEVRRELETWSTPNLLAALVQRDPQRAAAIHRNDRYRLARALEICIAAGRSVTELTAERARPERTFVRFRVRVERAELHRRIAARAVAMLESGWVDEVRRVLDSGAGANLPGLATLGYPQVVAHVEGRIDRDRMLHLVTRDTRRFARSQETWFRKAQHATPIACEDADAAVDTIAAGLARAFGVSRP